MEKAARELVRLGPQYVLVKGGHLPGAPVDVLWDGRNCYRLPGERLTGDHSHGTGAPWPQPWPPSWPRGGLSRRP